MIKETNWYVLIGAPSSGKTTILDKLQSHGYLIIPEVARVEFILRMALA